MQLTAQTVFAALLCLLLFGSVIVWLRVARCVISHQSVVELEPRLVVPWSGWDVLLLVFMVLALDVAAMRGSSQGAPPEADEISARTVVMASAARVIWLAIAVTFLSSKAGAYFDDLGFDANKLGKDVRLGLATFLAVLPPVYGVQLALTHWFPSEHPLAKLASDQEGFNVLAIVTVAAVLVAPLFEEFIFRVLLQGWLEKQDVLWRERAGPTGMVAVGFLPMVAVSIVFGMLHAGHGPDPAALFVLSLFLGYLYRQTHRIVGPLVVHLCFNLLAIIELWVSHG